LSKVLKAKRSLRRAKLLVLADLLGLDRDKVLRLAGFGRAEQPALELSRVSLLRTLDKFTLNVVVTPQFYDAALFAWIFSHQPLAEVGVDCQLRRSDWANIPAELASYGYSVGLHDQTSQLFRLERWSDLCLYRGDALVARGRTGAKGSAGLHTLVDQARRRGKRLSVVTMASSTAAFLEEKSGLVGDFDLQIIPNPDVALETFKSGAGDLFLGGLPQRLHLRHGDFRELVAFGPGFPKLFSFHSLICSQRILTEKRPILHAIDALWYDTCQRLYTQPEFRKQVFDEICDLLERQGIEKHSLTREDFDTLFSNQGAEFEVFSQKPADLRENLERFGV